MSPQGRGRGPRVLPPALPSWQGPLCVGAGTVYPGHRQGLPPQPGHSLPGGYGEGRWGEPWGGGSSPPVTQGDSPGPLCSRSPACDPLHTLGGYVCRHAVPSSGPEGSAEARDRGPAGLLLWGVGGVRLSRRPHVASPCVCVPLTRAGPTGFRPDPHPPQPCLKLTASTEAPLLNQVRVAGSGWARLWGPLSSPGQGPSACPKPCPAADTLGSAWPPLCTLQSARHLPLSRGRATGARYPPHRATDEWTAAAPRRHSGAPSGQPHTLGARVGPRAPISAQASVVPAVTGPDRCLPPRQHSAHMASSPERPASLAHSGLPQGHSCTQGSPASVIYSRTRRTAEQVPADATLWGFKQAWWHPVGASLGGRESTTERGGGSTGDGAASQGGAGHVLTKQRLSRANLLNWWHNISE